MPADPASRRRPVAAPVAWILPLLGWAAAWVHAGARLDPQAAAETRYLALLIVAVLLALAVPALLRPVEAGVASLAGVLAIWTLPPGPLRGAVVGSGLALCLAWGALRLAGRERSLDLASLAGLGIGLQVLFLSDLLLPEVLGWRTIGELLLPPLIGAVAVWVLARERPAVVVLGAAGVAVVAAGGIEPAMAAGLLALAGGELFARGASIGAWRWAALAALVPAFGVGLAVGLIAATGALLLALPVQRRSLAALPAVALWLAPGLAWAEALADLAWLALLVPGLAGAVEARWREASVATLLGVAAVRLLEAPVGLAVPTVLIVLALAGDRRGVAVQGVWSGSLLAAAAVAGAYPWLREGPAAAALGLLGLTPSWTAAAAVWLAAALARGLALVAARRWPGWRWPAPAAAAVALAIAVAVAVPPAGSPLLEAPPVSLTARRASWGASFEERSVREVRLVSTLTHAGELPAGTVVADVGLLDEAGAWVRLELRAGIDTAEWAARRRAPRQRPASVSPPAWLAYVAEEGRLLGERFRASRRLDPPVGSRRIEVHRRPELPDAVEVVLLRLELVP